MPNMIGNKVVVIGLAIMQNVCFPSIHQINGTLIVYIHTEIGSHDQSGCGFLTMKGDLLTLGHDIGSW